MADRFQSVLFLGAPGSGKGTQGAMVGQVPGFHHLSSGDVFRSLDRQSELGKLFLQYSTKGELVPDDVTIDICVANLKARTTLSLFRPQEELLLLDGIPRNVAQAQALEAHIDVVSIVHLVAKDLDAMVERMKIRATQQGRPDDADENVIRNRFRVYEEETTPVLAHYPADRIAEVDAMGTIPEVLGRVLQVLAPVHKNR